jgi:hypothetical protein
VRTARGGVRSARNRVTHAAEIVDFIEAIARALLANFGAAVSADAGSAA